MMRHLTAAALLTLVLVASALLGHVWRQGLDLLLFKAIEAPLAAVSTFHGYLAAVVGVAVFTFLIQALFARRLLLPSLNLRHPYQAAWIAIGAVLLLFCAASVYDEYHIQPQACHELVKHMQSLNLPPEQQMTLQQCQDQTPGAAQFKLLESLVLVGASLSLVAGGLFAVLGWAGRRALTLRATVGYHAACWLGLAVMSSFVHVYLIISTRMGIYLQSLGKIDEAVATVVVQAENHALLGYVVITTEVFVILLALTVLAAKIFSRHSSVAKQKQKA